MSNGAEEIAEKFLKKYGRGKEDVLEAALSYINNQGSLEAWEEHLYMDAPPNLWELFDEDSKPSIQKVDDYAPEGYTDDDAAAAFVVDLEDASVRAKKLSMQLDGEFVVSLPGPSWIADFVCWVRNLFVR